MSGYVCILENNLGPLHGKLVDYLGNSLLIAWDWMRAENNGIIWLDGNLLVDACCHTGKCCHGLTLASGCDQYQLVIRVILHLVDLDQGLIRNAKISKLCRCGDNIDHAAAFYRYLAAEAVCCIDDLLHTVYIGREGGNDNTCSLIFIEKVVKYMSYCTLRHGKARTLCIGGITHNCKNTLAADLCKTLQVNGITEYRCIIYLEVSCMHHNSNRGINSQCRCILDTVVGLNKLDGKITKVDHLTVFDLF